MFLLNIIGQFHFLEWTPFFVTFVQVYPGSMSVELIIHGCNYYHVRYYDMSTKYEVNFGRSTLDLIQLQIHIWVVLFDLNFRSTLALTPVVQSMSHHSWFGCGGGSTARSGSDSRFIFGLYFLTYEFSLCWYYVNPLLSSKFNILSYNAPF